MGTKTDFTKNRSPETGIDDISNIDSDISKLFTRFIRPIDLIRSISRPDNSQSAVVRSDSSSSVPISKSDFNNLKVNNSKVLESRAHAFYRYLGFPVISPDGQSFYNSGFNPNASFTFTSRQSINSAIAQSPLQTIINQRESLVDTQIQIFANQDTGSTLYALLLRFPRPFNNLDSTLKPLDVDQQKFDVDYRTVYQQLLSDKNPQLSDEIMSFGTTFSSGQHILRPFIVDPKIENTIMPDSNKICVPFLYDKKTTQITDGVYLQRPGIELIIRQRLSDKVVSVGFLNDVTNILSGKKNPSVPTYTLDRQTLTDTIEALSTDNNLSSNATSTFSTFTSTQVTTVSTLVETIKAVVTQLSAANTVIDKIQDQINWFPMPSVSGPETGSIGASLNRSGTSSAQKNIDNNILELTIKKLNAQSDFNQQVDLGNFASPFFGSNNADSVAVFDGQLKNLVEQRDGLADFGFKAMGNTEIINGEISGLGLIDILSIYTALWSIDITSLLSFLDPESFKRMITFNPNFSNIPEVASRSSDSVPDIISALQIFEGRLSTIFAWVDQLLKQQSKNPTAVVGGSV